MKPMPPLLMLAEGRRPRPRKAPRTSQGEIRLHVAIVGLLKLRAAPEWQWFHPANGERRDSRTARKLQFMGVRPGVPDLVIVSPVGLFHTMEFKAAGGSLSDAQRDWQTWAVRHGVPHTIARTVDEAVAALRHWGVLPVHQNGGAA